jgi:glycosyltransferase involved in cell wall biosynthesis
MENIRYSIIIPAYNSASTISKTLQGLFLQNGIEETEIIVVDDGSTDETAELVKDFPVRYIWKANGGPASARNLGIKKAQAEIILFLDSDCIPQYGWLKAMIEPFCDPQISGVKGVYITRQKSLVARFVQCEFEERYRMLKKQNYIDFVDSYSAGFKKEALLKVGGFDEYFPKADNEDVDLSYKLAKSNYRMVFQPQAVVEHIHPANLKKYIKVKFYSGYWRTAVYKRHPKKALKDSYTPQSLKLQILTVALFWMTLIGGILTGFWQFVAGVTLLFLLFWLNFILRILPLNFTMILISPFMLFLKANCFLSGIISGFIAHFVRK